MPPKRNGSVLDLFIFGFLIGGIDIVSGMFENYFLRVIPTMKHYSDIVSDMSSGSIYIYIWHSYSNTLSDILSGIYFAILSDILPGIYSDILSGILSDILSGSLTVA